MQVSETSQRLKAIAYKLPARKHFLSKTPPAYPALKALKVNPAKPILIVAKL